MMKIVITMVALLPMFVTFFVTFRTLELMIKFVPTLRTFMAFYLTFVMTLWTLVVMMDMALFTITIGFKTVHFIISPLFFSIYIICTLCKNILAIWSLQKPPTFVSGLCEFVLHPLPFT
jgi:hypothetical protein